MPDRARTELEAANLALALIKEPGIASFDEPERAAARECRKWFGTVRDQVLRQRDWNFASTYVQPAADPAESIGPLKKRFLLPEECLAVREVHGAAASEWTLQREKLTVSGVEVERVALVTNLTAPLVRYTARVLNVELWDAEFLIAFAAQLGHRVGPLIGRSVTTVGKLMEEARALIDAAAGSDARENAPKQISREVPAISARRRGRMFR
ncbi:MAG TPA: hypothetical protein VNK91_06520 [Burkholderiaceae bacterium]|nr:hypothetical protein [Burkholderiaceae bacterium]